MNIDKFTLQEEANKRGYERGFAEGKKAAFWHYIEDEPFKPEVGKWYVVQNIIGHDTQKQPVLSEPKAIRYGKPFVAESETSVFTGAFVFCWAEIPEAKQ